MLYTAVLLISHISYSSTVLYAQQARQTVRTLSPVYDDDTVLTLLIQ